MENNKLTQKDLKFAWKIINEAAGNSTCINGKDHPYVKELWKLEKKVKALAGVKTAEDMPLVLEGGR